MPFCSNCGREIGSQESICPECGKLVGSERGGGRAQFEGKIHKCPNCGEIIDAFTLSCPACGYEFRGLKASESVRNFALRLSKADTDAQRINLVCGFPIPNTKEDIFEFMILASSNLISGSADAEIDRKKFHNAWLAKFEQGYQKARLLFFSDPDFSKIQDIYDQTQQKIAKTEAKRKRKRAIDIIMRNAGVWSGIAVLLIAVRVDRTGGNSSMLEFIGCLALIISASILSKRKTGLIDFLIAALSGIVEIVLSFLLDNGSVLELCGGLTLLIVVAKFFRHTGKKDD